MRKLEYSRRLFRLADELEQMEKDLKEAVELLSQAMECWHMPSNWHRRKDDLVSRYKPSNVAVCEKCQGGSEE